ncbi:MAG TPA: pyruvate, water dikinase regulatory protein [Candidatus Sulfotelmatobacter sp.]|nr:pyruvate, water dikinase regulatory protein [Candidatus Sulfotelmatobacter sp.]
MIARKKSFHVHLVSDATGETLNSVANAALVQFEGAAAAVHMWALVRSKGQIDRILQAIKTNPGIVLFTLVDRELRDVLMEGCRQLQLPCVAVLDPVFAALAAYLGSESRGLPGRQHTMDAHYFERIEAMHFTMAHDDGQLVGDLNQADVVLVGVSRTSKTPTCIYLANRGIKAANVPMVPNVPLPPELGSLTHPLVVGLTTSADRLVQVRRNRLLSLNQHSNTEYVDLETVKIEVASARRLFAKHGWPVIDVSRRSIEETAAAILNLYKRRSEGEATA